MTKAKERVTAKKLAKVNTPKTTKKSTKQVEVVEVVNSSVKVEKPQTIGAFTKILILSGMAVKEIEVAIKEKFPQARDQINSIYYYRSQLHKSGELAKS